MTSPGIEPPLSRLLSQPPSDSITLSKEVLVDLDTPVSAYLKLRQPGHASFLLESATGNERIARYSFVGSAQSVLRIKDGSVSIDGLPADGGDPLDVLRCWIRGSETGSPDYPFEGGAVGYLAYEAAGYFQRLPLATEDVLDLPDAAFLDAGSLLVFDHFARRAHIVVRMRVEDSLTNAYQKGAERIDCLERRLRRAVPSQLYDESVQARELQPSTLDANLTRHQYEGMVRAAKEHIHAGDILQVVLAQRFSLPLAEDPLSFYRRLRVVSPSPYMYFLDFGDHQIAGASPELLVQMRGGMVTTRPIAGTRPRGRDAEEDARLAAELLGDEKERAEHLMLVDLARNDVGRVSSPGSVRVGHFMEVEHFSHVMHMVSDVDGVLRDDLSPYDALRAAFPAGTVSGAPKIRAMQIIAGLEPERRGPYAGALGFINPWGDMEMAITIRTAVIKDGMIHVQAGAGIVADSDPTCEYAECRNKARALLEAAGVSR